MELSRNTSGFTLIEVLLAMVVFSALMGLTTWGYSQYLRVWERDLFAEVPALQDYRRFTLMRRSVEGMFDYYVTGARTDHMVPFFEGRKSEFRYVTRAPVFSDADMAVARVAVLSREGQDALVYQEFALQGRYLGRADQALKWNEGIRIMDAIAAYDISYFALSTQGLTEAQLEARGGTGIYQWQKEFSAQDAGTLPAKVDLQLQSGGEVYRLLFHTAEGADKNLLFNVERVFGS